jgi:Methyltransferase FkbM domain
LTIPRGKSVGGSIEGIDYVLKTSNLTNHDVEQATVRAVTGDSLIESVDSIEYPNVVKIDVEGHEPAVLRGLAKCIEKRRPVIFFEHLYLSDLEVSSLIPRGYSLHSVDNKTGDLSAAFDRTVGHNSVLLPTAIAGSISEGQRRV